METVKIVAFLCLSIYFAKDGKPGFGEHFLAIVEDALMEMGPVEKFSSTGT